MHYEMKKKNYIEGIVIKTVVSEIGPVQIIIIREVYTQRRAGVK